MAEKKKVKYRSVPLVDVKKADDSFIRLEITKKEKGPVMLDLRTWWKPEDLDDFIPTRKGSMMELAKVVKALASLDGKLAADDNEVAEKAFLKAFEKPPVKVKKGKK